MKLRLLLPLAVVAATAACPRPLATPPSVHAAAGQEFALAPGQTAAIEGEPLSVAFLRVAEDSRCPRDVVCIRAGEAEVELELRIAPDRVENAVLNTTEEPRSTSFGPYTVHLVRLDPVPAQSGPPPRYVATLRVDKR
ncbi:MAG TPA: hypothetical protein VEW03_10680 [Longimicrobiaceae bacterium]|nr:hypothetical protein [Longimicrobiaceae bacterium]